MKRGTPQHPKITLLAAELGIPRYAAVGLVEMLLHWVAQFAKRGDVGRYQNSVIGQGIGWEGDADRLVTALVASGWLDEHPECRLYVHDWHQHADDAVHMALARDVLRFANGAMPKLTRLVQTERLRLTRLYNESTQKTHAVATPCTQETHCRSLSPLDNNNPPEPEPVPGPPTGSAPNADLPAGDELDTRIRAYVARQPGLLYSPIVHANIRKMVESASWAEMEDAIGIAIQNAADEPTSYARKVLGGKRDKARLKSAKSHPPRERLREMKVYDV